VKKGLLLRSALEVIICSILVISIIATSSKPKEQPFVREWSYVSVDSFLSFIDANPILKDEYNLYSLSTIDISENWDSNGNIIYLAKVTWEFMWGCSLYLIIIDNYEITEIINTGIGGNSVYFSYDVVGMSQGDFISAYCSSHMGNGNLVLFPISEPTESKYGIPAVDHDYEDMRLTALEYGLISGDEEQLTASEIYLGGKLHADYIDINQDGNTDIIMTGIQQIYETGKDFQDQILRREYYVKNVYLYNLAEDDFILSDILSERILINSYDRYNRAGDEQKDYRLQNTIVYDQLFYWK